MSECSEKTVARSLSFGIFGGFVIAISVLLGIMLAIFEGLNMVIIPDYWIWFVLGAFGLGVIVTIISYFVSSSCVIASINSTKNIEEQKPMK